MSGLEQAAHFEEPLRIDSYDIGSPSVVLATYELEATLDPPMPIDHVARALGTALPKGSKTPLVAYTTDLEGSVPSLEEADLVDKVYVRHARKTSAPDDEHDPTLQHLRELSWRIAATLGATTVTYGGE